MDDLNEAALLAGFIAHNAAVASAFCAALLPYVRARLKSRWKSLRHVHADIERECLVTVVEWRASGLLRAGESLRDLAARLVKQNVEAAQRDDEMTDRIAKATAALPADSSRTPEDDVVREDIRERVWDLQASLPATHQRTLEAHAEADVYGKKSLAELLGVTPEAARKMLQRAREALAAAIAAKGYTEADFR